MGWNQQPLREQAGFDRLHRLRGSVDLPEGVDSKAALDGIQIALMDQGRRIQLRTADEIRFTAPLFGLFAGSTWSTFMMFNAGQCRCVENMGRLVIVYDLTSSRTMVFAALLALAFGIAGSFGNIAAGLLIGVCAFAWLYGMSIWSASERVPGFLQRASRFSEGRPIPDPAALLIDA